jgi:hypothetical protein
MSKFSAITFSGLKEEVERYLKAEHNKAGVLFSAASPYGQILSVVENLHQLSILYLKNAIDQFDLGKPNSNNERVIRNAAIFAGHIPGRAISATGVLRLTARTDVNIEQKIANSTIVFSNKTSMKNKTNSLFYSLNLGITTRTEKVVAGTPIYLNIIQGKWDNKVYTSNGSIMQTYNVSEQGGKDVENFYVEVSVNGVYWTIKRHVYDLLPDEQACVVRTGFNGGVDVIFGNGGFGKVPELTQPISINYLITDGSLGNIYRRTPINDWKLIDEIIDANGNSVEIDDVFDVDIYNDINFGADGESLQFTKSLLPMASNNFVLALPQQYAYHLKRLGVFTHVNAEEKNGTIYIYLTPNIILFKRQTENYFSIPIKASALTGTTPEGRAQITYSSAFDLDAYEKAKIVEYLKSGGNIQLTRKFVVMSPTPSFYAMNIFVIHYSDVTLDAVKSQIVSAISDYFLDLKRTDRIPKLDIIRLLSNITDIHSVDIQMICKNNEDYHREGVLSDINKTRFDSSLNPDISNATGYGSYDPSKVIGLDPVLGDIIFEASEIPLLRGGWYDRNGSKYADEDPSKTLLWNSVNIITQGVIDYKNRAGI